jgi:hypothetical protein
MVVIETFVSRFLHLTALATTLLLGAASRAPTCRAESRFESNRDELQALQRSALRQAHLDERSRKSLEARLRLSALLPHLRVNVGRGWQWDYSSSTSSTPATATLGDDRLSYGVAAQWDLSRLLFQRDELVLRHDAQRLAAVRTQLLLRVARLYGQRCAAAHQRAAVSSAEATARLTARIAALDVSLAALIGEEPALRRPLRCPSGAPAALAEELSRLAEGPAEPRSTETPSEMPADLEPTRSERLDERQ